MAESALENFFDQCIDKAVKKEEKEEKEKEKEEEEFLRLLPDELLPQAPPTTETPGELDSGVSVPPPSVTAEVEIHPQIRNIVSTVWVGCNLDLDFIARTAWNVTYNPKTFKALTMRSRRPRATALIYKSGNIVCAGAKSKEQSRLAARRFARVLQKLGFPARFLNFKIQNLVGSHRTAPLNLEQLALSQPRCSYEPELFPGLFYRVTPTITATIFSNGKISLTGAKEESELYEAFQTISPILNSFRKRPLTFHL